MGTSIQFATAASGTANNAITFSERMRINGGDGNLGIGETAPGDNRIRSTSPHQYNIVAKSTNGNGGFHNFTGVSSSGSITSYITHNGRVGASDGIVFGSDTAAANVLDDYEQGVIEPTFTGSSGGTWTPQTHTHLGYTKIGDTVHIQGYININGSSSPSGNLEMSLPFVVDNTGTGHSKYAAIIISMRAHGGTTSLPDIVFAPQPGSSKGEFISTAANGTHTWINNTHIGTGWNIRIGGTYKTSA